MTAIASDNSTLFMMTPNTIEKMQYSFHTVYEEMKREGLTKFKRHKISIAKEVSDFLKELREGQTSSSGGGTDCAHAHSEHSSPNKLNELMLNTSTDLRSGASFVDHKSARDGDLGSLRDEHFDYVFN